MEPFAALLGCRCAGGLCFARGWLIVVEAKRACVVAPDSGTVKQVLEFPQAGMCWGACYDEEQSRVYVTDIRANKAKIFAMRVIGAAFDDGSSPEQLAARLAAARKAAEEEKMREWQAARDAAKKGGAAV